MLHTDTITLQEAQKLGIIGSDGLGFVKPQTAFKNITEQLLAEIKKGNLVWRQGWRSGVVVKGKTYGAQNYETQRPYTGGNAFFINMQNLLNGTDYRFFLTHKQIKERGANLKQGAKPFPVSVFIKNTTTETVARDGEKIQELVEEKGVIWYYVYPIDMVDGLKEIKRKTLKPDTFNEVIVTDADTLIENMPKAPAIKHGGDKAFYTPALDYVQMPHKKAFKVQQEYYSVLFHELIHSTGSKKRLNRDLTGKFGDKSYAGEELIAEIGAAFLCGVCEIDYYTINNSAAYLKSWSKTVAKEIKEDANFLKRTVFKAVRAANFIIGKTLEKHGIVVKEGKKVEVVEKPTKKESAVIKPNPLLSDYPKGLQKYIDIAYNNNVADALFKATKIKGVKQDVSTFFSENYNPDGKLSKPDSFVKFYNDVQAIKAKKNAIKTGKISPDKNIKATAQQAIEDLMNVNTTLSKIGAMALGVLFSSYKNNNFPDTNEGLKGKLFEKMELLGLVEYKYGSDGYVLTHEGLEVVKKIEARLETLKAKKRGTDLFPELAGTKITRDEYKKLLRDYDKYTGIYEDTTDKKKLQLLKIKIKAIEDKIHSYERDNELDGMNKPLIATKPSDIEFKLIERGYNKGFEIAEYKYGTIIKSKHGFQVSYGVPKQVFKFSNLKQAIDKIDKYTKDRETNLKGITDAVLIFINAFLSVHDKTVTREDLAYILATFQLAIKSGAIKAKHPLATIANHTQDKLASVINKLRPNEKIKLHISNKEAIENKVMGLHGLGFWNVIASAVVGKAAEIFAQKKLFKKKESVPALNGIDGFVRADNRNEVKSPDTFKLPGQLGKFLQNIQPFKYSIVLTGDPHAGKTEFSMQLADAFCSTGKTVGAFMLEQGGLESKDTKGAIDRNVSKENQKHLFVTGEAPKGINTIKECAEKFNVILIDSWQKLGIPSTKFDDLRHQFPNTIFIVIFQQNGEGGTRGGVSADYDTPVHLKVHKVDSTFANNYVEAKKNRGNNIGFKYMVKSKKTINES